MAGTPRERRLTESESKSNTTISEKPVKTRRNAQLISTDPNSASIRGVLQRYLTETKKDHVYLARNTLAAARLDLNLQEHRPGVIYDEKSPFESMKAIDIPETEAAQMDDVLGFKVASIKKPNTSSYNNICVPTVVSQVTPGTPLPRKCRAYTTLRNNILADNEEEMRYLPYFGETADDDVLVSLHLEDLYIDKTKESEKEGRTMEYAEMYGLFINKFLEELGVPVNAIIHYLIGDISQMHDGADPAGRDARRENALPDDLKLNDPKLRAARQNLPPALPSQLSQAEHVCRVFKEMTKISLWEVVKRTSKTVKNSMSPTKHTTTGANAGPSEKVVDKEVAEITGGNPWPYSLDSYASLNCLVCYMHECPFHVLGAEKTDTHNRRSSPASDDLTDSESSSQEEYKLSIHIPGWSYSSKQSMKDAFEEGERCSEHCFKHENNGPALTRPWSQAQRDLLICSAGVLRNNPRCACLCASVINRPCSEIHKQLKLENLMPITIKQAEPADVSAAVKVLKRKKTPAGYLPGYPADTDRTYVHEKRTDVRPCRHRGPCNSSCECVRTHVTCEKACACPPECPRKWRGCSCKRGGRPCSSDKCVCVKANRECDPDLCGTCGSAEILDPMNRGNDDPGVVSPRNCQNVSLQREQPKKTLLGHSTVSGMGLFAGEDIEKNEFIGEYKGEIVTNEEADRRGTLYDMRGISFLFTLNSAQAIDATRMGNKFRFINHSSKVPNCSAKVTMANCAQRIGFWATRNLQAGEELFFDYGYNHKQVKFVQKEPPTIPQAHAPQDREITTSAAYKMSKARQQRTRARLEYLRGGKGTTERSRKAFEYTPSSPGEESVSPTILPPPKTRRGRTKKYISSEYVRESSPSAVEETELPTEEDDEQSDYEETPKGRVEEEEEEEEEEDDDDDDEEEEEEEEDDDGDDDEEEDDAAFAQPPAKKGRWSGTEGGSWSRASRRL